MQTRWVLSTFYTDSAGQTIPAVADYGQQWLCPTYPATSGGSALVLINIDPHQIDAAGQDTRIVVCPLTYDPSPVPASVVTAYASWGATTGMSMGALLAKLASAEPIFATQSL